MEEPLEVGVSTSYGGDDGTVAIDTAARAVSATDPPIYVYEVISVDVTPFSNLLWIADLGRWIVGTSCDDDNIIFVSIG